MRFTPQRITEIRANYDGSPSGVCKLVVDLCDEIIDIRGNAEHLVVVAPPEYQPPEAVIIREVQTIAPNEPMTDFYKGKGLRQIEKEAVQASLVRHKGSLKDVARELMLDRTTLRGKIDKYQLDNLVVDARKVKHV